eukprot:GFUD01017357.1.p1 GENE.GFUD01017357.1~~GFUD01017357.1.p1  ORF type:complete len:167 (+),score=64.83 GFUD01017357.1:67-567(+)
MQSQLNLNDEDVNRIRAQFQTLDKNGDGILTVSEMRQTLNAAGKDYTLKDVQKMVKKADKNGDGRVVWEEFLELMAEQMQKIRGGEDVKYVEGKETTGEEYEKAMQAFKLFDKNGDGMIDLNELKEAMKELNLEQDPEKVEELLKGLDENGDGVIDYVEFGRLLGI